MPDQHVVPIGDSQAHIATRECWCDPSIIDVYNVDLRPAAAGGDELGPTVMVIHNAAAARDFRELRGGRN